MSGSVASLRAGRGLQAFAGFALAFMVLVILWGAVVRATGSGAGCGNNWPLCNGQILPHHPLLKTIIEFTHRSMSGICTALTAVLTAWVFWSRPRGDRARKAVTWTCLLLVTEALLGAVLVKGGYVEQNASNARVFMQCIHFTNTLLLLGAFTLSALWLRGSGAHVHVQPAARSIAWLAVLSTLVVGATGSVAALADTLFPSPSLRDALSQDFAATAPLLVRMRWIHPASAMIEVACVLWLCVQVRSRQSTWLAGMLELQIVLGVADVLLLAPTWMQVLHLLGADIFWIMLVAFCADTLAPAQKQQIDLVAEAA